MLSSSLVGMRFAATFRGTSLSSRLTASAQSTNTHLFAHSHRPHLTRLFSSTMASQKYDAEKEIKRNPHGDFKAVEASRPAFDSATTFHYTQTPQPAWKPGDGPNTKSGLSKEQSCPDPWASRRPSAATGRAQIWHLSAIST
jgi:hypothetical protein